MSSGMVPLELSKDNNQYCKISVFMPNAGSINESVISVTNVGGDSFSVAVSMIRWNANKVFCKLINGTKISNINMYYTVDTEKFCFYIKANWYAKIIVSRLGLVNTSKIESINAIPSGAIEVPISWRDKRYSTDLGELIGVANAEKNGLMSVEDKKRLGRRFFKGYTKLVESKYWYNHYVALIFGASPASNLGSLIAIDWKGNELISVTRFFGNNDNVKLYLGSNPETNMYELWLGLIGLDGDGSEFIIQSRESIDLDSKTVETLPSYLKVISISWQKNNDFSELGELIGINDTWIRRRFAIKDCNTAIAGAYNVDDSTTNNFPTGAYKFGTLLVANSGFFGSQYFVPDNFNADPYIYIRSIGNDGTTFNKWAKIKVTIIT